MLKQLENGLVWWRIEELSQFLDEQKIDLYLTKYSPFHRRFSGAAPFLRCGA